MWTLRGTGHDPMRLQAALRGVARLALHALHAELVLSPKPGLVTPHDNGSHDDMNARTFMRSLASLRNYFVDIAVAGARGARLPEMQQLGIAAEKRMLAATGGINTHRGAIFTLGLLAAAAGRELARGLPLQPHRLCATVRTLWGPTIVKSQTRALVREACEVPLDQSHGASVRERYGVCGARSEAARGFPSVLQVGLPALDQALAQGLDARRAKVQTLFALMSELSDTNILYRGGAEGLRLVQDCAADYLRAGGAHAAGWEESAARVGRELVARRLSPGGSADLLSATWYLHLLRRFSP